MQIFLKFQGNTACVDTSSFETIDSLRQYVAQKFVIDSEFGLYSQSAHLESLDGVQNGSSVEVMLSLLGGLKGKKRKAFTTPKKNKHKHKNTKLMALNYYTITSDGVAERIRKLCIKPSCKEQGIFMANHWNRYYCGKCHLTLIKKNAPKEEPKKKK